MSSEFERGVRAVMRKAMSEMGAANGVLSSPTLTAAAKREAKSWRSGVQAVAKHAADLLSNSCGEACGSCGGATVETIEQQEFGYRAGDDVVTLAVKVPVISCLACGDQVTDCRGEDIRTAAVDGYLVGRNRAPLPEPPADADVAQALNADETRRLFEIMENPPKPTPEAIEMMRKAHAMFSEGSEVVQAEVVAWRSTEDDPPEVDEEVLLYCPDRAVSNRERVEIGVFRTSRGSQHSWASLWAPVPWPGARQRSAAAKEPS